MAVRHLHSQSPDRDAIETGCDQQGLRLSFDANNLESRLQLLLASERAELQDVRNVDPLWLPCRNLFLFF